jgi:hypothetical protein
VLIFREWTEQRCSFPDTSTRSAMTASNSMQVTANIPRYGKIKRVLDSTKARDLNFSFVGYLQLIFFLRIFASTIAVGFNNSRWSSRSFLW